MQAPNIVRNHSRQKAAVGLHVTVGNNPKKHLDTENANYSML
jgi:hypothetical protein